MVEGLSQKMGVTLSELTEFHQNRSQSGWTGQFICFCYFSSIILVQEVPQLSNSVSLDSTQLLLFGHHSEPVVNFSAGGTQCKRITVRLVGGNGAIATLENVEYQLVREGGSCRSGAVL